MATATTLKPEVPNESPANDGCVEPPLAATHGDGDGINLAALYIVAEGPFDDLYLYVYPYGLWL